MAATYRCNDCGHTAGCGKDSPPSLCPECGGNNLALKKARVSPPTAAAPAPPPEEEEEEE